MRIPAQEVNQALLIILAFPYKDVELTLAALKTLEQIGDASVIATVERLAAEPPATPNMKRVREAAKECLPYLRIHSDELKQAQTLLRPSETAASGTESLLRPAAQASTETPREQLLRAADLPETQALGSLSKPLMAAESAPLQEQKLQASQDEK
jgi:hypothetical protein